MEKLRRNMMRNDTLTHRHEGDHKGPLPTSTSTPALTMTTDPARGHPVVIVRAGVVARGCGDPCGCPGEESGSSPVAEKKCQGERRMVGVPLAGTLLRGTLSQSILLIALLT